MTQENKIDYPIGATYQPKERQLNMSLEQLHQLNNELQQQWKDGFEYRHKAYYDSFIVDPKPSQLPLLPPDQRVSVHGLIILPLNKSKAKYCSLNLVYIRPESAMITLVFPRPLE